VLNLCDPILVLLGNTYIPTAVQLLFLLEVHSYENSFVQKTEEWSTNRAILKQKKLMQLVLYVQGKKTWKVRIVIGPTFVYFIVSMKAPWILIENHQKIGHCRPFNFGSPRPPLCDPITIPKNQRWVAHLKYMLLNIFFQFLSMLFQWFFHSE